MQRVLLGLITLLCVSAAKADNFYCEVFQDHYIAFATTLSAELGEYKELNLLVLEAPANDQYIYISAAIDRTHGSDQKVELLAALPHHGHFKNVDLAVSPLDKKVSYGFSLQNAFPYIYSSSPSDYRVTCTPKK